jgi:hypothetical protein
MAAEHGKITDGKKDKIEQVVGDASAKAGVAALKADAASGKVELAVARLEKELHELRELVGKLIRKICPDDDDSFHEKMNLEGR